MHEHSESQGLCAHDHKVAQPVMLFLEQHHAAQPVSRSVVIMTPEEVSRSVGVIMPLLLFTRSHRDHGDSGMFKNVLK